MSIANQLASQFLPNSGILTDVQILLVDNDRDSGALYAFLLESHGAEVISLGSIKDALNFLTSYIPAILICDLRFLGETVDPLIQRVRALARHNNRTIPILATSTCPPMSLAQKLMLEIDSHLRKPIDIDCLIEEVWNLVFSLQDHSNETRKTQLLAGVLQQPLFQQKLLAWKKAKLEQLI